MSRAKRRVVIGAAVVALVIVIAVVFAFAKGDPPPDAVQPFAFDHKIHIEKEVECLQCHEGLFDAEAPRVPPLKTCAGCHTEPSDDPRLQELAALVEKGEELDWQPLYRLPDHVYFSHIRHVDLAKLECTACHADMPTRTRPPLYWRSMTMNDCIECHADNQDRPSAKRAVLDCASCHR